MFGDEGGGREGEGGEGAVVHKDGFAMLPHHGRTYCPLENANNLNQDLRAECGIPSARGFSLGRGVVGVLALDNLASYWPTDGNYSLKDKKD